MIQYHTLRKYMMDSNSIKQPSQRVITLYDVLEQRWNSLRELKILNLEEITKDIYIIGDLNIIKSKVLTISDLTRKLLFHFNILPHDVRCAFVIGEGSEPNIVYVRHYRDKEDSKRQLTIGWLKDRIVIKSSTGFSVDVKNVTELKTTILNSEQYAEQIKNVTKSLSPVALTDTKNKNEYSDLFKILVELNNQTLDINKRSSKFI